MQIRRNPDASNDDIQLRETLGLSYSHRLRRSIRLVLVSAGYRLGAADGKHAKTGQRKCVNGKNRWRRIGLIRKDRQKKKRRT